MIRVEMWEGAPGRRAKKPWFAVHFSEEHRTSPEKILREICNIGDFYKVGCGSLLHPLGYLYYEPNLFEKPTLQMFGETKISETITAWPVVRFGHTIDFTDFGNQIAAWTQKTRKPLLGPNEFVGWEKISYK